MQPIVHGLEAKYGACVDFVRANFHADNALRRQYAPIGTPEFLIVTPSQGVIHHWIGGVEAEVLDAALGPLCSSTN